MAKGTLLCVLAIGLTIAASSFLHEEPPYSALEAIKKCDADKFQCRSGRCIPKSWVCDQDSDCENADDEESCPTKEVDKCGANEYQCEVLEDKSPRPSPRTLFHSLPASSLFTNICIPKLWLCDGETDCAHGDDETNCKDNKVNCTDQQYQCQSFEGHSSTCIPKSWKCDGTADCAGGFDEHNCTDTPSRQCDPSIEFKCGNGKCIYNGWKCDGDDDCGDGKPGEASSDEKDCADKKPCDEATHFKCKRVQFCILKTWVCDGEADCPDQSDEEGCTTFHPVHNVTCKDGEFKCAGGSHCINNEFLCDGDNDCPDKSDELNCKEKNAECKKGFKACSPGICRLETDFCNGIKDCPLGEDELNCAVHTSVFAHTCNPDTEYTCPNETPIHCIAYTDLCSNKDAHNDCSLSSVCNRNLLLGNCNYTDSYCKCRASYTNNGTICTCPDGFENRNGMCLDIDECKIPGACDQKCDNLPGSFRCHCHRGYRLVRDEHALKATKCRAVGSDPLLLLSNRAAIRQYDMMTNRYQPLVNRLESAVAMDYWHKNETLIWSDVSKEKIMMCQMKQDGLLKNQTNCIDDANTTLVSKDVSTPDGLAVDWVHGLLFWTDTGLDKIYVLDLVTRHRRVIIDQGLDEPRAIAVDPTAGLIFWSDWGSKARIERAGMDGKNRVEILSGSTIRWPNGLAVDILDQRVYWADAKIKTISSSDYYGRDVRTVLHSNEYLRHPFSLTVFEERLYWSDWDQEGVLTVNKFRGDDVKVMISGVSGPMTVRVYHEQAQPNNTNKCDKNVCSHLCLPRAHIRANFSEFESNEKNFKPYTCACATGYFVDASDMTACILEKTIAEFSDSASGSTIAMIIMFIVAVVCALGITAHVVRSRRSQPFSALQFENPVYRRTTEDPDAFEYGQTNGDNSLGAFPSDVTNPPLLPSRLVLNQPHTPTAPLTGSNDFYHPNNYAYDQPITRDETQHEPSVNA